MIRAEIHRLHRVALQQCRNHGQLPPFDQQMCWPQTGAESGMHSPDWPLPLAVGHRQRNSDQERPRRYNGRSRSPQSWLTLDCSLRGVRGAGSRGMRSGESRARGDVAAINMERGRPERPVPGWVRTRAPVTDCGVTTRRPADILRGLPRVVDRRPDRCTRVVIDSSPGQALRWAPLGWSRRGARRYRFAVGVAAVAGG